ncbi:metallophosphoesterase family protein [Agriterribacter sp.]|uniref:metallophosphoesterase family protein n=1 Tax=Agriterribacter sp. TaxID=2821509 RepID=UPI002D030C6D|nr:metallophosphoesterase family protein [Agriterribacter sp.]HRO45173.1 metallophosphoesterase family protein [Agriterribacter sp.]HRQ17778.1 metallophosphoesterase family protein [Agriterribacter sp.]
MQLKINSRIFQHSVACCLAILICAKAQAQQNNLYPPSPYPDRIVLNVTQDPSTSLAVNWRTHDSITAGSAEIIIAVSNPADAAKATVVKAKTESVTHTGIVASYHSAVFSGLRPGTRYMYRVGNGDYMSEWFHVKTAGNTGEPFSFIYMGDVQMGMRTFWPGVIREAYTKMPDAKLILYAGDIVNRGRNDHEWGELFYGGSFIHSTIPGMMSPGNHEHADNAEGVNELTALWRPQFTLPENGPAGLEETCYYTDVQGVRFISLNSQAIWFGGDGMQKQINWLENILSNNPNQWTCVVFHHPVYSVKSNRDNKNLRENFQPIFNKYKVDLVLQGHDHAYGRGMQKIPMPDNSGTSPTMYVVSMSGSKMYADDKPEWADKSGGHLQLYQLITINGKKLSYRSYTVAGELFDAFDLVKRKGKNNKLISLK